MADPRVITWHVIPSAGFETAWVDFGNSSFRARGRALGTEPVPYWLSYELEIDDEYVTRRLRVTVEASDRRDELDLRNESGAWSANGEVLTGLDGALDCDLGLCPLTNTMPILRHGLHRRPGRHELVMAWVAVPELTVKASRQTYTHLGVDEGRSRVRYESGNFTSDLVVDQDGLVLEYPQLASRIAG